MTLKQHLASTNKLRFVMVRNEAAKHRHLTSTVSTCGDFGAAMSVILC